MLWLCAVLAIHYVFCTSVHDNDHTHHWAPEPLYVCVCICRRVSLCHLLFRLGSVDWIRIDYAFCLAAMASYQYILPWHIPETAIAIQYTRFAILHPANEKSFEPKQRQQRQQRKKKLQTLCCVNVCVYNKRHVSVRIANLLRYSDTFILNVRVYACARWFFFLFRLSFSVILLSSQADKDKHKLCSHTISSSVAWWRHWQRQQRRQRQRWWWRWEHSIASGLKTINRPTQPRAGLTD